MSRALGEAENRASFHQLPDTGGWLQIARDVTRTNLSHREAMRARRASETRRGGNALRAGTSRAPSQHRSNARGESFGLPPGCLGEAALPYA